MSYTYNQKVSAKANNVISTIDIPKTYEELFFREGLFCEFSPLTEEFICCWCFDTENGLFWMNQGHNWKYYENVETDSLARHFIRTIPFLDELLADGAGYGLVMETLCKLKNNEHPKDQP